MAVKKKTRKTAKAPAAPSFLSRRQFTRMAEQVRRERISQSLKAHHAPKAAARKRSADIDLSTGFDPDTED